MCGLAGLARLDGSPLGAESDAVLRQMARSVLHRGPEETTITRYGPVGLAFTRLSLVDPEGGAQPLATDDGAVVLIANGEIYNHRELAATLPAGTRLRTRSDCEVLLHLYRRHGLHFLDDVRGMFALVLWDRAHGRLVLARDRFGIKPLYFTRNRERIAFGSEIKTLFADPACPRRLDWTGALADQALTAAPEFTDDPPVTWFEGVDQVPPATVLQVDLRDGATREHRYWSLPIGDATELPDDAAVIDEYGRLLAESVTDCLMADVEIGLFLSGGVDSAAVAALAARSANLHTFTAVTGSTVLNGDAEKSHRVAAALGLTNHQVLFEADRVPGVEEWQRLLWLTETPLCGPEQFYKFELHRYVKAQRPDLKAMLLGAAADEFNGGYTVLLAEGGGWDDFLSNMGYLQRQQALRRRPGLAPWWELGDLPLVADEAVAAAGDRRDPYASFVRLKQRDIVQYNCWHEDRTAAGNGIEARVPFLDHRLVELVAGIPPARRERLLWDKRILRAAMSGVLPAEIAERPKVAFYEGEAVRYTHRTFIRMLDQDGGALLEQAFSAPGASRLVHRENARRLLRRLVDDPAAGHVEVLLRLVNLGLLEQQAARPPAPPVDSRFADVPRALPVHDWAAERERIELLAVPRLKVGPDSVLSRRPGLLLVRTEDQPSTVYLAVDGGFRWVVDAEAAGDWLRFLRAVDGRRTVEKVLADLGQDMGSIRSTMQDAVELGVLVDAGRSGTGPAGEVT